MRADIAPSGTFPDYEPADHTKTTALTGATYDIDGGQQFTSA